MSRKLLILIAAMALPLSAWAEESYIQCESSDGRTKASVVLTFPGTYSDLFTQGATPTALIVKNLVIDGGKPVNLSMTGTAKSSGQGPHFDATDLKNRKNKLAISAPAANKPSVLTFGGRKIEFDCN